MRRQAVLAERLLLKTQLTEDVPKHTNKVAHGQHDNQHLEGFEEVRDGQDRRDVVVVDLHIVFVVRIREYQILELILIHSFNLNHELIAREKINAFRKSHYLD